MSVVTRDDEGSQVIANGEKIDLAGHNVKVVDPSGAGDVFAAAFFLNVSDRTTSARKAGEFANAAAALSVREVGPFGVPNRKQVEHLLETGRVS